MSAHVFTQHCRDRSTDGGLAIPILQKNIEFLIQRHTWFATLEDKPEDFGELLSTEWTRSVIASIVGKGAGHLTQVSSFLRGVFDMYRDCGAEPHPVGSPMGMGIRSSRNSFSIGKVSPQVFPRLSQHDLLAIRQAQVAIVESLLLERLQQPHAGEYLTSPVLHTVFTAHLQTTTKRTNSTLTSRQATSQQENMRNSLLVRLSSEDQLLRHINE